jgi:hypothetical protein
LYTLVAQPPAKSGKASRSTRIANTQHQEMVSRYEKTSRRARKRPIPTGLPFPELR